MPLKGRFWVITQGMSRLDILPEPKNKAFLITVLAMKYAQAADVNTANCALVIKSTGN